jgi:large subunit ribosomal protein L1
MTKKVTKKVVKKVKTFDYDKTKSYSIAEAVELAKKFASTKFDGSIEAHFRLGIDVKKGDQQIRAAVSLPHGTGKTVKVCAFVTGDHEKAAKAAGADVVGGEDLIEEIKKTEKTDFEVAIATPDMMRALAPIAKILGTRGLMPSPKNDTVTTNPAEAIAEIKKGKISFKNDDTGNIHMGIGKVSFESQKLAENFAAVVDLVKKIKPAKAKGVYIKNVSICSTMGPGIKVSL